MSILNKILIALGVILTLGLLSVIIYQQVELSKRQQAIESEVVSQKDLADKIVRSQSDYATKKDIQDFINGNGLNVKTIEDDLDKLKADITSTNKIVVDSSGSKGTDLASTSTGLVNPTPKPAVCKDGTPCPNADPLGYMAKEQDLSLSEKFADNDVPIGQVGFSAWQDKPWSINLLPREYDVVSVVGTDENQRQYFYNKFMVKVDGKEYDVKINSAETKQEYPSAKFSWWNPRLYLGADLGAGLSPFKGDFVPNLDIGLMSYGKFLNQPDFSILQLGIGYGTNSRKFQFILTPFTYNIGPHIPLMNNLYIGPSIMVSPEGNFSIMGGIRVGL